MDSIEYFKSQLPPSIADCHANDLIMRILKLRWIGMEDKANELEHNLCEWDVRKALVGEL